MFKSLLLIPLTLFSLSILCSFTLQSMFVYKKLINALEAISYLRNYYYLCCMNIITLYPNTSTLKIRSMYGSNIAHDALQKQGMQSPLQVMCACGVAVERFGDRV